MATNVQTPRFRVSFPQVFEAKAGPQGGDPKYSISMLFDEGTDLSELKKAAAEAVKNKWGDKPPARLKNPFLDAGTYTYAGYEEGMTLIRASTKTRPGVVDRNVQKIISDEVGPEGFYPGCYAIATLNAFTYDVQGNKGVSFGLNNIQKVAEGEPLGGRQRAEDDFEAIADDNVDGVGKQDEVDAASLFD